jgi:hypothetical protein
MKKDYSRFHRSNRRYCYSLFIAVNVECKQIIIAATIALFQFFFVKSKNLVHVGHIKNLIMIYIQETFALPTSPFFVSCCNGNRL